MEVSSYAIVRIGIAICMGVAIALATSLIGWKGSSPIDGKSVRLDFNPLMKFMGWFMLVLAFGFPLAVILLVLAYPPPHVGHVFGAAGIATAFLVGGIFVWRETRLGRVVITPERVELFSPWAGSKVLEWTRVSKAELGPIGWVILSGADGSKLTFRPTYWAGIEQLEKAVRQHVAGSAIVTRTLK